MSILSKRISNAFRESAFCQILNFHDDRAKGRVCMILSGILANIYSVLVSGIFFTGFLLENDITMVDIGFVTSIPFFCSFFSIFTPFVLGRFPKRRLLLGLTRIFYFVLNILGITLIPMFDLSHESRIFLIAAITFISNAVNSVFGSGYSAWHVHFLPDNIRARFFSLQQTIMGVITSCTQLTAGLITDAVAASGNKLPVMIAMRMLGFGLAIIECLVLMWPKEYKYETTAAKVSLLSIFRDPFRYKKFMLSMVIIPLWTFSVYLSMSAFDVYVLDELHVSYSMINIINASYCLFIIVISPFWKRYMNGNGSWFLVILWGLLGMIFTRVLTFFIGPSNYMWLYPLVRILQHTAGVGFNFAFMNLPFINLPKKDQTSCLAFHTLSTNFSAFIGQITGTAILEMTQSIHFDLWGIPINNVKFTILAQAVGDVLLFLYILKFRSRLEPQPETETN